jgi:SAM-dependent methyltransferase
MKRLDIGCSFHKVPGWIGVDIERGPDVEVLADLHILPFKDSSVDEIHSRHTLEHVRDPLACISELFRATKPGGTITIIVPHYSNHAYWADVTHLRPFGARAFEYYDLDHARRAGFPIYLPKVNLRTRSVRLTYWPERIYRNKSAFKRLILSFLNSVFSGLANLSPFLCERFWCYWVGGFYEVTFVLEPIKRENA